MSIKIPAKIVAVYSISVTSEASFRRFLLLYTVIIELEDSFSRVPFVNIYEKTGLSNKRTDRFSVFQITGLLLELLHQANCKNAETDTQAGGTQ